MVRDLILQDINYSHSYETYLLLLYKNTYKSITDLKTIALELQSKLNKKITNNEDELYLEYLLSLEIWVDQDKLSGSKYLSIVDRNVSECYGLGILFTKYFEIVPKNKWSNKWINYLKSLSCEQDKIIRLPLNGIGKEEIEFKNIISDFVLLTNNINF